ncbi:hypothetical protein CALCODRAFT_333173 [Calocera cornea HHB12733]|uniref:P-loop containing nucleoside triphosphate hydrolase protein n=1 Tax=Calocera cornea HHB12733 TaxID=1353952 RepID=A0A165F1L0_9BASI|nr:hypothetical protein CALCODRAFT_333173 [Calocera cornea HHB12733]
MVDNVSTRVVLPRARPDRSILQALRNSQRTRGSAYSASGLLTNAPLPSVPPPVTRYSTIREAAEILLSLIPDTLPDAHKRQWGQTLRDTIVACNEPPCVNITFVGEMGAGKSKLQNVLLKTNASKVGRSSGVGTHHPTKFSYHDLDSPSRAVDLFTEEELKNMIQDLTDDAWDFDEDGGDMKGALEPLSAMLGRHVDFRTLRNTRKVEHIIHAAPFFHKLGTRIPLDPNGSPVIQEPGTSAAPVSIPSDTAPSQTMVLQLPVKVEHCYINSQILRNGLIFMDSPGLGDTNAIRAAGAKRALAQASTICIVAPLKRCDSSRIVRELARICQQQYLDGKEAQIIIVLTQCDHGLPQDTEMADASAEDFFTPAESTELRTIYEEISAISQLRQNTMDDVQEFRQELKDMNIELPRARIKLNDGSGVASRIHDISSDLAVHDAVTQLEELEQQLDQADRDLEIASQKFRNRYAMLRARDAKRRMRSVLQQWVPQMDVSAIPIFAVAAECYERLRKCGRDECHMSFEETEIPALDMHLRMVGERNMRTHAYRLERDTTLVADRGVNFFSTNGQGKDELMHVLTNYLNPNMNPLHEALRRRLSALFPVSGWASTLDTACYSAAVQARANLLRDPEEIFKDAEGKPLRVAATMKAACRRNRRGVYVGINFNDAIANIYLDSMKAAWSNAFFSIRQCLINVFDHILEEVDEQIRKLDNLHYLSNDSLRGLMVKVGATEHQAFHLKMKTASYHAGGQMEAARL